jgi:hypothetical protein
MYQEILEVLFKLIPEPNYHHAKIYLELGKTYARQKSKTEAFSNAEKAKTILDSNYPTDHPIFIDYYFALLQMQYDVDIDRADISSWIAKHEQIARAANQSSHTSEFVLESLLFRV